MKSKGSGASQCVQALGGALWSLRLMFITSALPAAGQHAGRARELHCSRASRGRAPVAAAPPAFCLHKLDLVQHIGLSGD